MNSSKKINNLKQANSPTTKLSKRRFLAGIAIAGALSISSIAQAGPHCNKLVMASTVTNMALSTVLYKERVTALTTVKALNLCKSD